jgi:hypothetical protein
MPSHLLMTMKVPLPEGSLVDQGDALGAIKLARDALVEALPAGEYSDKIVKSSGNPRKPRAKKAWVAEAA